MSDSISISKPSRYHLKFWHDLVKNLAYWNEIEIYGALNILNDSRVPRFLIVQMSARNLTYTGSSPASHQRRCSLRHQPPTSWPCQSCSARSTLAPNLWANIIQGVPHDNQRRQWNSADIHDWHGHAHFRSSRSVSSPQRDCLTCLALKLWLVSGLSFNRWSSGLEWSPCPCSSHLRRYQNFNQHSELVFPISLRYFPLTILSFCGLFLFNVYFSQKRLINSYWIWWTFRNYCEHLFISFIYSLYGATGWFVSGVS